MATVVLQVLIDMPIVTGEESEAVTEAVKNLLTDTGEFSGELFQNFAISDVNVVFEDII